MTQVGNKMQWFPRMQILVCAIRIGVNDRIDLLMAPEKLHLSQWRFGQGSVIALVILAKEYFRRGH